MSDLISRQAAIDALGNAHFKNYGNAIMVIQAMPSAEPVRHGKWIYYKNYDANRIFYQCSVCNGVVIDTNKPWYQYCPNCGARMNEE